ncbi:PilZ domain-containing protein [Blastococcus goldschmidtiae]|uniref:PilZ domain-containing protein n=1 Tax=Blastococcus goldschmidtiae TaxID=3075546 RepID=A0ABU2K2D9_9ACTN|nr:PilZ domain-containing protein [Blastococcus sp. DSM 46792]MDT0274340.1 PilZ domain-containing protein [Blastococcus sp. DSM 46792]
MTSVPGVDHPEEQSDADVTLAERGISINSRVEFVGDGVIVVRPSAGEFVDQSVVVPGDSVEVYWKGTDTRRALPADVVEVESGAVVRWRLRIAGPSEESQRRTAVRGRVVLPVTAGHGAVELTGESVDLSENGVRAQFEGFGVLPESGAFLDLTVGLEDGELRAKAEVVRAQARGARWLMSIRFVGIQEKDQDRVRRRVFQALREERAKSME